MFYDWISTSRDGQVVFFDNLCRGIRLGDNCHIRLCSGIDLMQNKEFNRDKMLKIMGYFNSSHDGEILAAVNRALAMLNATGTNWNDIIVLPQSNDKPKPKPKKHKPKYKKTTTNYDYHSLAKKIDRHHLFYALQENQIDFIIDMVYNGCGDISNKQKSWLNSLAQKMGINPIDEPSFE